MKVSDILHRHICDVFVASCHKTYPFSVDKLPPDLKRKKVIFFKSQVP